jgi:hypothetical protein
MIHCSLIDQQILMKLQDHNSFLEALFNPFSLLAYLSETSSYSPHHHSSVLVAFLDLCRLSLPSDTDPSTKLALNMDLCKVTIMLSTVPKVVLPSHHRMPLVGSQSRHRPITTST